MTQPSHNPVRVSGWITASFAVVSLAMSGFYSWAAFAIALPGLVSVLVGVARPSRIVLSIGAFALFIGGTTAGVQGAPLIPVLTSVTCAVLAWDIGGTAISIGNQLSRESETLRVEVVHAFGSLLVGLIISGIAYALYNVAPATQTPTALLVLLVAVVLLVGALSQSSVGT